MEWNKRKERTGKIEQSLQLLSEETFKFQRAISTAVFKHDIPTSLIVNLDQTPLRYFSPGKYTFSFRGAKNVRIKGVEDLHWKTFCGDRSPGTLLLLYMKKLADSTILPGKILRLPAKI